MSLDAGYQGKLLPDDAAGEFNQLSFLIWQILATVHTVTLVKVVSVTSAGGVAPAGYVDVQPLVNQLDGDGNAVPHGVISNVPYFRIQGGSNAIILDPEVGDIGLAAFAQNDISSVKTTQAQANPGSRRRFHWSDGLYFGGFLNGAPSQYIQFVGNAINIVSPGTVTITTPGNVSVTAGGSAIIKAATIVLQNAGTALKALLNSAFATWATGHVHSNGNGGADTGTPTTTPGAEAQTSVVSAE